MVENIWAVAALPEPRWGNSQRPPNPVASGEGVAAPLQEPPLSAYGLSVVAQ